MSDNSCARSVHPGHSSKEPNSSSNSNSSLSSWVKGSSAKRYEQASSSGCWNPLQKAICGATFGKTEEILDHENQQRVDGLAGKISRLKGIALDLETESRDSNRYLDGMQDDFGSTQGLLSGSVTRITNMVNSGKGNRKVMCYIIIGLVSLFFLAYYLVSKVTAG